MASDFNSDDTPESRSFDAGRRYWQGERELKPQSWRGGARIDLQNVTYPYARLSVSTEELELRVAQVVYRFRPSQVRALEVVRVVPLFGKGVRIHHDVAGYPQLILFWTMGNPAALAQQLRGFGFGNDPDAVYEPTDFPQERATGIVMMVMWVAFAFLFGLPLLLCLGCCGFGLFSSAVGGGGSPASSVSPPSNVAPTMSRGPMGTTSERRAATRRSD